MPHLAETNWAVRSNHKYDIRKQNYPRKPTDEEQLNNGAQSSARKRGKSAELLSGRSGQIYQHTGDRNLNRYRLVTSNLKSEKMHMLTTKNGAFVRTSRVAASKTATKKKTPRGVPKSPTPKDVRTNWQR